jgi:hypothetical protein
MRQCFIQDNSGHYYAIPIDCRGYFLELDDQCGDYDNEDVYDVQDEFEAQFGDDRLEMHVSNYSFDDLQEID